MKPGPQKWATNSTFAAGPDTGSDTKDEIPTGRVADGFQQAQKLSPNWENMLRWRLSERIDNLSQVRLNWSARVWPTAKPAVAAGAAIELAGVYRGIASSADNDFHHVEFEDSVAGSNIVMRSVGGQVWSQQVSISLGGATPYGKAMAADSSGNAGIGISGLASGLYYSLVATPVTWVPWAGTGGQGFYALDFNPIDGYWIGAETTNPGIYTGNAIGVALTLRDSNAGIANTLGCIWHSKHGPGILWPQDAGNKVALFVSGNGSYIARATDAASATWVSFAASPFLPIPADRGCLKYSYWGSRWGIICSNGPTTGINRLTFAYSDDNGANWVENNDPFGHTTRTMQNWTQGTDDCVLLCDGWGHWVTAFNISDGSTEKIEIWASVDNGVTWFRIYAPWTLSPNTLAGSAQRITGWYGNGEFYLAHVGHSGAASIVEVVGSLRVGD